MLKLSIILGVILLSIGGFLLYKYIQVKNAVIKVELKDNLEADFADTLRVSSFIENINGNIASELLPLSQDADVIFKYLEDKRKAS